MRFRKKPVVVEATQWFKDGDHCVVRPYPCPYGDSNEFCQYCNNPMHIHGWINAIVRGYIICPGDWIVMGPGHEVYPWKPKDFEANYDLK